MTFLDFSFGLELQLILFLPQLLHCQTRTKNWEINNILHKEYWGNCSRCLSQIP